MVICWFLLYSQSCRSIWPLWLGLLPFTCYLLPYLLLEEDALFSFSLFVQAVCLTLAWLLFWKRLFILTASGLICNTWDLSLWCTSSRAHGLSFHTACGILIPWPGIPSVPPAFEGRFLTTRSSGGGSGLWWFNFGVSTFVTPWTVVHQASLSMGFPRQEYWSALPFSFFRESSQARDQTWVSCIAGRFFTSWATREAQNHREVPLACFLMFSRRRLLLEGS